MHTELFNILRCPYCGGRLDLVTSLFHRTEGDTIRDGILGCECCVFPVVDGIAVMHLHDEASAARGHLEAGRPDLALRAMVGLHGDLEAEAFEQAIASPDATFKTIVDALGPGFEGGYFLYRFSDPTYVVAHAVVRAVAGAALGGRLRAVDICGGSGHLTRVLLDFSSPAPVLADLYFAKIWLARRFTAPGCEPVCCDGNAPLPFARGAFGYAMCSDAFHYIWHKRQFIGEMVRLVEAPEKLGTVVINHAHNQLTWSPSHGQPLTPTGYRHLFETVEPRLFAEKRLLASIVAEEPLDLSQAHPDETIAADPALTLIATGDPTLFRAHPIESHQRALGEFRLNPLYEATADGDRLHVRLRFPSEEYEGEYGDCRQYLPDETWIDRKALALVQSTGEPGPLEDLVRRRVIVDLPRRYC